MSSTSKSWDYIEVRNKTRVTISIDEYQLKMLDKLKRAMNSTSRSEIVRKILDTYMYEYIKCVKMYEILTEEQLKQLGM